MGKQVGDYTIIRDLGEGAFSKVKLAVNTKTGVKYAIKITSRELLEHSEYSTQLHREMNILYSLNHPNLIKLHHIMRSQKSMYLVLDYADGGELFSKIASNGPLPEDQARSYFQQLIDALDYLHSQNITHRDIKPENILLDSQNRLKLTDFGLSIMSEQSELLQTRCGTPSYIAPEIFVSKGYRGPPTDIWSAGVLLFVMLTATLPFPGSTIQELMSKITKAEVSYPKSLSHNVVSLLKKILVADPLKRYTIPEIRSHRWFKVNYHPISGIIPSNLPNQLPLQDAQPTQNTSSNNQNNNTKNNEEEEEIINAFELMGKITSFDFQRLVDNTTLQTNAATTFSTTKKVEEMGKIISDIFKGLNHGSSKERKGGRVIKAQCDVHGQVMLVRIELVNVASGTNIVEISRLKGDQFDFMNVYNLLKSKLETH